MTSATRGSAGSSKDDASLEHQGMSPREFRQAAHIIVGEGPGWQNRIAVQLGVHKSTISRWMAGQVPIAHRVGIVMRLLADGAATSQED